MSGPFDEVLLPNNIELLKNTLTQQVESTLDNRYFQDFDTKLGDILQKYERYIDPVRYNQRRENVERSEWQRFVNYLAVEGFDNNFTNEAYIARHNHFLNSLDGTDFINNCTSNINTTVAEFKEREEIYFNKLKDIFSGNIKAYRELYNYKEKMGLIKNNKINEIKKIKSKIDTYSQNLFLDSRKDKYENENYEFYKSIHFYLLIIYYSIFVLFFIFSNFIQEKQYYNKKNIFYIILYLIFPIILPYMLAYMNYLYVYYLEFNNMKDEIVSYPDLVNKYHNKIE